VWGWGWLGWGGVGGVGGGVRVGLGLGWVGLGGVASRAGNPALAGFHNRRAAVATSRSTTACQRRPVQQGGHPLPALHQRIREPRPRDEFEVCGERGYERRRETAGPVVQDVYRKRWSQYVRRRGRKPSIRSTPLPSARIATVRAIPGDWEGPARCAQRRSQGRVLPWGHQDVRTAVCPGRGQPHLTGKKCDQGPARRELAVLEARPGAGGLGYKWQDLRAVRELRQTARTRLTCWRVTVNRSTTSSRPIPAPRDQ